MIQVNDKMWFNKKIHTYTTFQKNMSMSNDVCLYSKWTKIESS